MDALVPALTLLLPFFGLIFAIGMVLGFLRKGSRRASGERPPAHSDRLDG